MLSYPFSIFYYEIEKRKTKGRYIHGPFIYVIYQIYYTWFVIIFPHLHQKLTFSSMSTPQCHKLNLMTFDVKCHEICFVGRKNNVVNLMS